MKADSHAIVSFGVAVGLATANDVRSPALFAGVVAACLIGGLLPDIDHVNSRFSRWVPLLAWPFWGLHHRGLTHSVIGFVGLTLALAALRLPIWAAVGVLFGFMAHLVADMLTPGGVQLLWPLAGRCGLPLVKTGSVFEPLAGLLLAALFVFAISLT